MKFKDLTGQKFGRLTVLHLADEKTTSRRRRWVCRCECGRTVIVQNYSLTSGNTKSCGCLRLENNRKVRKTHGLSRTPIYRVWGCMIARCRNPRDHKYTDYGGRGIKVCDSWLNFASFYSDVSKMEHFGEKGYTLDRINNDGDYEPKNVRWANLKTQGRNKRNNRLIEIKGELLTLAEISERYNLNEVTIQSRLKNGDTDEDLIRPAYASPKNNNHRCKFFIDYNGEQLTISQAAQIAKVSYNSMLDRYKKGLRGKDVFKKSWYERKKEKE